MACGSPNSLTPLSAPQQMRYRLAASVMGERIAIAAIGQSELALQSTHHNSSGCTKRDRGVPCAL